MTSVKQGSTKTKADAEVLLASVNLGLETLVVVHQQLNTRDIALDGEKKKEKTSLESK